MKEFVIDLFCGAGGTSAGVHLSNTGSIVTACVNHDENAIESHRANFPQAKHFIEDIRNPEVVFILKLRVDALRKMHPDCIITIWASLECTNFSKAKGGLPREADSRTLANHLFMYLEALDPDFLMIENVIEFKAWGPLNKNGRPESKDAGKDFIQWRDRVKSYGYRYSDKVINSADLGAYTSRSRYFAQFAKRSLPISWPEQTHAKKVAEESLFTDLKPWKAVKDVLDLENEGTSIFNRKKPLVENTLKRIYAGLVKFVANGDDSFIQKHFSGRPKGKVISTKGPAGTITTAANQSIINIDWILKYNSNSKKGKHVPPSTLEPSPTVTAQGRLGLINAQYLVDYQSGPLALDRPCNTIMGKDTFSKVDAQFLVDYQFKSIAKSLKEPSPTLLTKDKFAKICPHFLVNSYSGGGQTGSVDSPAPTITNVPKSNITSLKFLDQQFGNSKPSSLDTACNTITINPKYAVISAKPWIQPMSYQNQGRSLEDPCPTVLGGRKHHYIMNPQFSNKGNSIEMPCPTIIARQDKKPLGLISCEVGSGFLIPLYEDECETMIKIKVFMAHYGIVDIKMRMLLIPELLRIQGFPEGYELIGTQTQQKKYIGNSVEVTTAKKIFEAHFNGLVDHFENKMAA